MEVFATPHKFIILNKKANSSLWCSKADGSLSVQQGTDIKEAWDPQCVGIIYGVIGKVKLFPGSEWKVLVIRDKLSVGHIYGSHEVFKIEKVSLLTLSDNPECQDIDLQSCAIHRETNPNRFEQLIPPKAMKTINDFRSSASNKLTVLGKSKNTSKEIKERDKMEKRLMEELLKLFNESDSFYYCPTGDITNSMQRQQATKDSHSEAMWKCADERFFWNKFMLNDLISLNIPEADAWIMPVMQGFIQIERCHLNIVKDVHYYKSNRTDSDSSSDDEEGLPKHEIFKTGENLSQDEFDLLLISRRSRHRAGTRYKRRGANEKGHCANYVETEQIVCVLGHWVSFVQVRGSVPIFWSQPGYKYRPPPRLDKDVEESAKAFKAHFDSELKTYGKEVLINLVEQTGREKIIADAFFDHVIKYNSEDLTFVIFDFHEHCRGMKFENVRILLDSISDIIQNMNYCWFDVNGVIVQQKSVFRINCMDCLDRTNVVQATIARTVLETLLCKMGRVLPDQILTSSCRRIHNNIWANNGDVISRQYAGTAAMKGDFTRTGERKLAGLMKDSYNSANRYYLNRFKDTYRQAVIDMLLGNPITEDLAALYSIGKSSHEEEPWTSDKEECIAQLVLHSQLSLLDPDEECMGGWALIDPFTYYDEPQDEDVILLLTRESCYIARYDDQIEQLLSYQRLALKSIEKLEIGVENHYFKGQQVFMRIHYKCNGSSGYHHTLRTIQQHTLEESKGILLMLADTFSILCEQIKIQLKVTESNIDGRKKSKMPKDIVSLNAKRRLSSMKDFIIVDKPAQENNSLRRKVFSEPKEDDTISLQSGPVPTLTVDDYSKDSGIPKSKSDSCIANHIVTGKSKSCDNSPKHTGLDGARFQKNDGKDNEGDVVKLQLNESLRNRLLIKSQFKDFTGKLKGKINQKLSSLSTFGSEESLEDNSGSNRSSKSSLFPDIRNRFTTALSSPKLKRSTILTDEQKKIREECKSKIIEV